MDPKLFSDLNQAVADHEQALIFEARTAADFELSQQAKRQAVLEQLRPLLPLPLQPLAKLHPERHPNSSDYYVWCLIEIDTLAPFAARFSQRRVAHPNAPDTMQLTLVDYELSMLQEDDDFQVYYAWFSHRSEEFAYPEILRQAMLLSEEAGQRTLQNLARQAKAAEKQADEERLDEKHTQEVMAALDLIKADPHARAMTLSYVITHDDNIVLEDLVLAYLTDEDPTDEDPTEGGKLKFDF